MKKLLTKKDLLSAFVIGEACALILPRTTFIKLLAPVQGLVRFFPFVLPVLSILGVLAAKLVSRRMETLFQMAKSFLVGILNTSIDFLVFDLLKAALSVFSGWPTLVFKAVSFGCATTNSYFWNRIWSFEVEKTEEKGKEVFKFFLVTVGGLLIHVSTIHLLVNIVGPGMGFDESTWASLANVGAVFAGFLWNFFGYKLFVFKK